MNAPDTPRVLLVGQSLGGGGAETRFRLLAKHIFEGTADVAVLVANATPGLPPATNLGWRGNLSYGRIIWRLRRQLRARPYDAVMAFGMFPNIVSVLAIRGLAVKPKLVINEITRPIAQFQRSRRIRGYVYTLLRRHFYPAADRLTANSIDGLTETCELANVSECRAMRTPNVMDLVELCRRANEPATVPEHPYFICIARLDHMKRIDTIVEAWQRLDATITSNLIIVGSGEARTGLEAMVTAYGLQARVRFAEALENPMPLLKRAQGFILASEYEGFSNAVLEAMCLDVPVITSLCSSDARQMCALGAALGFEVGDSRQLANRILELTGQENLAAQMLARAKAYREPHVVPAAIHAYEKLLLATLPQSNGQLHSHTLPDGTHHSVRPN